MHKTNMAKTLLTALSKYEQFIAAIDKSIINTAQYSYQHYSTTMNTLEDIIDSMDKKQTLHNLRVKTQKLLDITPHKFRRVLILTYVHQLCTKKVAEIIKKSQRTVFRNLRDGLEWFSARLDTVTDNYDFANLVYAEPWLKNIYNRLQE
jgi:DNA-directed RNA polymerase specialized sigma24 family protein